MRRFSLVLALLGALSGCGQQIGDFVRSGDSRKSPLDPTAPLPDSSLVPGQIRRASGAGLLQGTQLQGQARLSRSGAKVTGTQVQGRVSISQNRTQP